MLAQTVNSVSSCLRKFLCLSFFLVVKKKFICLILAVLGLHCCVQASHCGGFSCGAQALAVCASVTVVDKINCPVA